MTYSHLGTRALLLSAVALTVFATAAHAGFEWKGPVTPPPAPPQAMSPGPQELPPMGAPLGEFGGLEPVIVWDGQGQGAMPAVKAGSVEQVDVANNVGAGSAPNNSAAGSAAADGEVLEGFGTALPLVIALQQVAPAGYRMSFSPGVDPGAPVSWSGGKPWKQVLADMLATRDLSYKVEGDSTLVIGRFPMDKVPPMTTMEAAQSSAHVPVVQEAPVPLAPPPVANDVVAGAAPEVLPPADTVPPPSDRVLIGRASQTGVVTESAKTVEVRREKPASFLEKLGFDRADDARSDDPWNSGPSSGKAPAKAAEVAVTKTVTETVVEKTPPAPPAPKADSGMPIPLKAETVAEKPMDIAPMEIAPPPQAVPVEAPAAPATTMAETPWHAAKGQTLRDILKNWSNAAGVDLYWSIDYDYRLESDAGFSGSYDDAVARLLDKFDAAKPRPYGQLHQSGSGPRVLVIKAYGVSG